MLFKQLFFKAFYRYFVQTLLNVVHVLLIDHLIAPISFWAAPRSPTEGGSLKSTITSRLSFLGASSFLACRACIISQKGSPSHQPHQQGCALIVIKYIASQRIQDKFVPEDYSPTIGWIPGPDADPPFSVGARVIPIQRTRPTLPGMVPRSPSPPPATLPKTAREVSIWDAKVLARDTANQAANEARRAQKIALGIPLGPEGRAAASPLWDWVLNQPSGYKLPAWEGGDPNTSGFLTPKKDTGGSVDLGTLLGDIASTYIGAKYAPTPVGYGPPSAGTIATLGGGSLPITPAIGVPFVDVIPETSAKNMVWDPRANCGEGKWIRRGRRRRRRRLASASDIKDLASLKSVMGPSALKSWIATHPS